KPSLAKLVHDCSARRAERFLVVACGTLSGNLIASEFFGHVKGSFTGADGNKVGKFEAAGEGTILLDEIDTLGLEHQANLLRVIETGEFEPVGGNETQVCRARIIAATNWNLADAVERGTFRRDLYYRLHVISFHLPPLRHRPEDIGPLVSGMVARYGTKYGKRIFSVSPEALRALEEFPWPGNIRQLENVVQQAVLTSAGSELKAHHLSPQVLARVETPTATIPMPGGFDGTLKQTREATERANILRALEKAGQSRTPAACKATRRPHPAGAGRGVGERRLEKLLAALSYWNKRKAPPRPAPAGRGRRRLSASTVVAAGEGSSLHSA